MIAIYGILLAIYLVIVYFLVRNALKYVKESKEFKEDYASKFDYYFDTFIFTLFWLTIVILISILIK